MIKMIDIEVCYEKSSRKVDIKNMGKVDPKKVSKVVESIKEGKRVRESEGPKYYGTICGC